MLPNPNGWTERKKTGLGRAKIKIKNVHCWTYNYVTVRGGSMLELHQSWCYFKRDPPLRRSLLSSLRNSSLYNTPDKFIPYKCLAYFPAHFDYMILVYIREFIIRRYAQRNIFEIILNQPEIRLYLPCTDWFGTANRQCPLAVPN